MTIQGNLWSGLFEDKLGRKWSSNVEGHLQIKDAFWVEILKNHAVQGLETSEIKIIYIAKQSVELVEVDETHNYWKPIGQTIFVEGKLNDGL